MAEERKYDCVLASPTGSQQTLPPYPETWEHDLTEKSCRKRWDWRLRSSCASTFKTIALKTTPAVNATQRFIRDRAWLAVKKCKLPKPQIYAFLLLLTFGAVPMFVLGWFTKHRLGFLRQPFSGVFADKVLSCGNSFGTPENSTVSGIEKLFVLDSTYGRFSFSQAKTMDVVWDILVGRGLQLLAAWVGYT
jgi:hypothetical protein